MKKPAALVCQTLLGNIQIITIQRFQGAALNDLVIDSSSSQPDRIELGVDNVREEDYSMATDIPEDDAALLAKFLPPPPEAKCPVELQEKINKFLAFKRHGRSFNSEVRNKKDNRNPDFLLHVVVTHQHIDHVGSCFSTDVFDPHGYDKSDFYDVIEADMKRESERNE